MRTSVPSQRSSSDRDAVAVVHRSEPPRAVVSDHPLLRLQRTIGNRAVQRLLREQIVFARRKSGDETRPLAESVTDGQVDRQIGGPDLTPLRPEPSVASLADASGSPDRAMRRILSETSLPRRAQEEDAGLSSSQVPELSNTSRQIARQVAPGASVGHQRLVVDSNTSDKPRGTRITVFITGHASPRWKSARSAAEADKNNVELSHQREAAVRKEIEMFLRRYLPDEQLVFEPGVTRTVENEDRDDVAHIDVAESAAGSRDTLREAGKAGRQADEPAMRRVEVTINLTSITDVFQDKTVQETHQRATKSKDWALNIGVGLQVDFEAGAGGFNFMLKNEKTGQEAEGFAHFSVAAPIAGSVPVPTISMSGYADFNTKAFADFSDFHAKNFIINTDFGINLLLFGFESSDMTILGLPGGPVSGIDVGGLQLGGAGGTFESKKFGAMYLRNIPDDTYTVKELHDEHEVFVSKRSDTNQQTILFGNKGVVVSPDQKKVLDSYVGKAVQSYEVGED